jgi:UDP-4-amino-4,6-dideoxy-N-acetyl-beta-L-altrosamine N-acetyltransferase
MENIKLINFVDLTLEEKKMILDWRNNEDVRKWMYTQEKIKFEKHITFIDSLKLSKDKLYFLVKKDKENIGVIDFTQIIAGKSLHMGIYTNPNIKGNGKILLNTIIRYSFDNLKVKKIYSEVFSENYRAYDLYKNFNFKDISKKIINEKEVTCMELDYENW